jgi:hypothetical protein
MLVTRSSGQLLTHGSMARGWLQLAAELPPRVAGSGSIRKRNVTKPAHGDAI